MKQLFTFLLAAMTFVACTQNDVEELTVNRADAPETLTVGFEDGDTRIELNEALKTVWTEGDKVSVFYFSNANQKWQFQGETGERVGDLRCVDAGSGTPTKTTKVVIAYPYDEAYYLNSESCNLQAMLPAVQSYKAGSYGEGGNILVSQSEYNQFSLKSVCGWLRVELTGEGQMVESIKVRGNAGEQVAGELYIDTATAEATLASERGEAGEGDGGSLIFDDTMFTEVTLDCGEGVELGAEATEFYIALPPQTFAEGMTIEVNCAGYKPMTLSTESSITIERNHIVPMEAVEHEADSEPTTTASQLWYTATALVEPNASAFNVAIVSNEWNEVTGEGVIIFDGELTTIGDSAFYECTSLTSVTIPDSVTTIGSYAFLGCSSLTSVTIPDSVTTIGNAAFSGCDSLAEFNGKFAEDGGRCLIIDGVLNAFALGCGVTEYTIPDSVTTIGEAAFVYCYDLTSVTIPDSVTTIGDSAFAECSSLTSVTIPDSVTTIGWYAFLGCESLTSVTIGDSVTTIGDYAFRYCSSLTSITIPDSVTTIGASAFENCNSLTSVYCKATTPPSLGYNAFKYYGNRDYVNICCAIYVPAESVEAYKTAENWSEYVDYVVGYNFETGEEVAISNKLFYTATALVKPYDASAFNVSIVSNEWDEATGEGIITFDGELTTIGYRAFYNCYKLRSVTIPDSVTTIGDMAFWNCSSLAEFKGKFAEDGGRCLIIDGVLNAFALGCGVTEYTIPDSVTTIGDYVFSYCDSLTSVTIPDSVTTIGEDAFAFCDLTSVTIGDSVTTIGTEAFALCYSLTSVTIGDSVTTIGDYAFAECHSLTSVTIPDSVTTIGRDAFRYCSSLTSVTIPDSVTTIGYGAFMGCGNLAEFKGKFAADGGRCLVKDNTLIAYANASGTAYTIPDSVTTIGEDAFSDCESLTSVTIPDSVTTIGDNAFRNCDSLTSVTIPDSVTTIGNYAFYRCSSLTSVTIPDSVTTIGEDAFSWCSSLTSVYCKATTPPTLGGSSVFDYNKYGRKIYVPEGSLRAYKMAENWSNYADCFVEYDFETGEVVE